MEEVFRARLVQRHTHLLSILKKSKETFQLFKDGTGVFKHDLLKITKTLKCAIEVFEKESIRYAEKQSEEALEPMERFLSDQMEAESMLIELETLTDTVSPTTHENDSPSTSTKLPKLELMKFDGNILKWTGFWDRFEENIHSRNLKNVVKLSYLLSMLEGDARQAVEGLSTTNDNYIIAIEILKSRFGSKEKVVDAHYGALNSLDKASEAASNCRHTLDEAEKHLRILQSMGEDINNNHLRTTLLSKFPETVLYQVNLICSDEQSVESLRKALEKVISATERSNVQAASISHSNNHNSGQGSTTEALHIREAKTGQSMQDRRSTSSPYKSQSSSEGYTARKPKRGKLECEFCEGNHYSDLCRKFPTLLQRRKELGSKCFKCFRKGHQMQQCGLDMSCFYCSGRHNRALCPSKFGRKVSNQDKNKEPNVVPPGNETTINISNESITECLISNDVVSCLQTATTSIESKNGNIHCRLLLDCGSQRSYLTKMMANKLGLTMDKEDLLMIYTFGSNEPKETHSPSTEITLKTKREVSKRIRINVVPHITGDIPVYPVTNNAVDIVADDDKAGRSIDLLIGNDYYFSFIRDQYIRLREDLYLVNSDFGWLMSGNITDVQNKGELSVITYSQCQEMGCSYITEPDLPLRDIDMNFLWALESIGIVDSPKTTREEEAVNCFNKTAQYKDGRYEVKWPWTHFPPPLPTNYGLACGRLKSLLRRLDQESLNDYDQIIKEQLEAGVIELVEQQSEPFQQTTPPVHYLPHHMVKQQGKRGRIVYDASAKIKDQMSLNECMYRGPSMLEDLLALLLQFRTGKIGILADVEKAFLQVGLQEEDRDVTRFLWVKDPTKEPSGSNLIHLRFCRVPFGVISSPFLLTATMRYHMAKTNESLLKDIADKCYVDNLVTVAESTEKAEQLYSNTRNIFQELSMNIREWSSNDQEFISKIPEQHRAKEMKQTKVLGLTWNLQDDTLQLRLNEKIFDTSNIEETKNKRNILRTLASIYDPCGFAAVLVLPAKILLQDLWKRKLKWDTPLDDETRQAWKNIINNLQTAREINIPRYIGLSTCLNDAFSELHCFTDASKDAYAAVVYFRATSTQETKISFIMSKSRVTPLKEQEDLKIPKLELLGYLIGSRLLNYASKALGLNIQKQYLWTDSLIVLSWVRSNKLLPPFVQRRVDEIRSNRNIEHRYVNTNVNPADLATRPGQCLRKDLWFNGPQFLLDEKELWPCEPNVEQVAFCASGEALDDCDNDSPEKPIGVEMDWIEIQSGDQSFKPDEKESDKEKEDIKSLQKQHFPQETAGKETHLSRNLGLYSDIDGILRCRGRLGNTTWTYDMKHPILIPKDCEFTNKIIRETHENNYHVGVPHTLSIIRQQYWITQGRAQVQRVLKKCERCIKHGGGPYKLPLPPALPTQRVNYSAPFTFSGLDYFGPLIVSTPAGKEKRWGSLYTCLAVRAIHIEIVKDLTAQECLLAFRRFVSCRGMPEMVVSDNATQFKLMAEVLSSPFCTENSIKWKFIPQLAPWHGGFYERLIGLVKHCLKRSLEKHLLSDTQLATVIKEIESVINSRPLTRVGSEPESVLRPSDFLTLGRCLTVVPPTKETSQDMTVTKRSLIEDWKRGTTIVEEMKHIFNHQYLPSLRERYQNSPKQPRVTAKGSPQVGDVVQILGDTKNRENWKVGKITYLIRGSDGECRVAKVRVGNTEFTRSIGHLYPLEIEMNHSGILDARDTAEAGPERREQASETSHITDVEMLNPETEEIEPYPTEEQTSQTSAEKSIILPQVTHKIANETITEDDQMNIDGSLTSSLQDDAEEVGNSQFEPSNEKTQESRVKRIAAIKARKKIAEWTSQLAALL